MLMCVVVLLQSLTITAASFSSHRHLLVWDNTKCPLGGTPFNGDYRNENIIDVADTCRKGSKNNADNDQNYCPACDLYVDFSAKAVQTQNPPFTQSFGSGGHQLVLPIKPCRGVDDWKTRAADCGGEAIFDYAWQLVGTPATAYALAINPSGRRGRHQMHVHVAKLEQSFKPILEDLVKKNNPNVWYGISCPTNKVPKGCSLGKAGGNDSIQAKWVQASSASAAKPFENVYSNPANTATDTLVVTSPTGNGWVIVRANDRQAECFLYCEKLCQDRCV